MKGNKKNCQLLVIGVMAFNSVIVAVTAIIIRYSVASAKTL